MAANIIKLKVAKENWYIDLNKISRIKLSTDKENNKKFQYRLEICYDGKDNDIINWSDEEERDAYVAVMLKHMNDFLDVEEEVEKADPEELAKSLADYDPMAALK